MGQALPWIVPQHRRGQFRNAILAQAQLRGEHNIQALGRVVEPLSQTMQKRGHARLGAAHRQSRQPLPRLQQLKARGALQAMRLRGQMLGNLVLRLGNQLGCGGGRGRAQVGGKVRDREVGLMPYG